MRERDWPVGKIAKWDKNGVFWVFDLTRHKFLMREWRNVYLGQQVGLGPFNFTFGPSFECFLKNDHLRLIVSPFYL